MAQEKDAQTQHNYWAVWQSRINPLSFTRCYSFLIYHSLS